MRSTTQSLRSSECGLTLLTESRWEFATFHPIRPGLFESVDKRNYYLTNVRMLDHGVTRLEHKNREGERLDIIYDRRGAVKGGWLTGVTSAVRQTMRL